MAMIALLSSSPPACAATPRLDTEVVAATAVGGSVVAVFGGSVFGGAVVGGSVLVSVAVHLGAGPPVSHSTASDLPCLSAKANGSSPMKPLTLREFALTEIGF